MYEAGSRVADAVLTQSFGGLTDAEHATLLALLSRVGVGGPTA